jgi:hypothetical protein
LSSARPVRAHLPRHRFPKGNGVQRHPRFV